MKRGLLIVALCFWLRPAAASDLGDWLPELGLIARIGDDFISTHDVAVEIVLNRALRGAQDRSLPEQAEWARGAARVLSRRIMLDAARRGANVVPDVRRVDDLQATVLAGYGGAISEFETRTGVAAGRLRAELVQRATAEAFVRNVLLPSLRLGVAGFGLAVTESGVAGQVQLLQQLKSEILRLRDRFLERQTIKILDPRFTERDLLDVDDALATM